MALQPTGLGKGLDALIRDTTESRPETAIQTLALADIIPNSKQPRTAFDESALHELAESIRSQGLLQPILVRPLGSTRPGKYEIVAGERRWRASQIAGLQEVPVYIRNLTEQETMIAALIENLQREDLNPIEEALGLQNLKDTYGLSQEELSKTIGKSRSAIANSLRLLTLPESVREHLVNGAISAGHARALLSVLSPEAQQELLDKILQMHISVREAEALAGHWKERGSFDLPDPAQVFGSSGGSPAGVRRPSISKARNARLVELEQLLGGLLNIPVQVSGKNDKGTISLFYNSAEELTLLLETFKSAAANTISGVKK